MAKNTSSSAFRKINVDQYNEDNFKEDEIDSNGTAYTGPDDAEITKLLNTGKHNDALKLVLENAPLSSKNQQAKVSPCCNWICSFCRIATGTEVTDPKLFQYFIMNRKTPDN